MGLVFFNLLCTMRGKKKIIKHSSFSRLEENTLHLQLSFLIESWAAPPCYLIPLKATQTDAREVFEQVITAREGISLETD